MSDKELAAAAKALDPHMGHSFLRLIGAKLEDAEPGKAVVSCEARDDLRQHHGFIHGGVITTIADVACGAAAVSIMPEGHRPLSVEFKVNHMRTVRDGKLIATAEVIKPGRTFMVVEATVTNEPGGQLIAKMLATMYVAPPETAK